MKKLFILTIFSCIALLGISQEKCIKIDSENFEIGQSHNKTIIDFKEFANINGISNESIRTFLSTYQDFNFPVGFDKTKFIELYLSSLNDLKNASYDFRNFGHYNYSVILSNSIKAIINDIETIKNYDLFSKDLDELKIFYYDKLNCDEYKIFTSVIAVSRNSAKLWMPVDLGGKGFVFSNRANDVGRRWWQNALIGDCSASAQFMLGVGVGGAVSLSLIPGTNGLFFAAWGIAAGIGSACAAL